MIQHDCLCTRRYDGINTQLGAPHRYTWCMVGTATCTIAWELWPQILLDSPGAGPVRKAWNTLNH